MKMNDPNEIYDTTQKEEINHSLPHPDEMIKKSKESVTQSTTNWKTTLAGVAGNVLEWCVFCLYHSILSLKTIIIYVRLFF